MYVDVILPLAVVSRLSYHLPKSLEQQISIGSLVVVPMGRSTIYRAIVVAVEGDERRAEQDYKDVIAVEQIAIATPMQLRFWEWISSYYCCQVGDVMRRFLPSPLRAKVTDISQKLPDRGGVEVVSITEPSDENINSILDRTKKAKSQYNAICKIVELGQKTDLGLALSMEQIRGEGISRSVVNELSKKGFVEITRASNPAIYHRRVEELEVTESCGLQVETTLSMLDLQRPLLVDGQIEQRGHYLLALLEAAALESEDFTALLLLPDSREARRMVELFRRSSSLYVTPYYGDMSSSARAVSYQEVIHCEGRRVVIGTKEAVALPLGRLDMVVVDSEEHPLYKQSHAAPTFSGRDCAVMLSRMFGAVALLLSETPSVESMYNVAEGKYGSLFLGLSDVPKVTVIDRRSIARDEKRSGGEDSYTRYVSSYLADRISETLGQGGRVLLFHARRGFSQYLLCEGCGEVVRCPQCNVSLTYHKSRHALECHYCSYKIPMRGDCPSCSSDKIRLKGVGTENIEERIVEAFPEARVCRVDSDSRSSGAETESADIVVGTQLVSRLDGRFDLTAIINSDTLLSIPDFRATERAMRLVAQLKAMTHGSGELVVQGTLDQTPYPMMMRSPYRDIYPSQIRDREIFAYPPVAKLVALHVSNRSQEALEHTTAILYRELKRSLASRVSPPEAPFIEQLQGEYRRHMLIKIEKGLSVVQVKERIGEVIAFALADSRTKRSKIRIDVDPLNI